MGRKRRHLLVFGFLSAIIYIIWRLMLSFLVFLNKPYISGLDWMLLITSSLTLVLGLAGIFTEKRYGYYLMSLFLLSLFLETILVRRPEFLLFSFPLFIFGCGYLAYTYRLQE